MVFSSNQGVMNVLLIHKFLLSMWLILISLVVAITANADMGKIELAVHAAANAYDIDRDLIMAVIAVESGFNQYAVGTSDNEVGLLQLHPRYFPDASFDIWKNVQMGVAHLAEMRRICGGRGPGITWVNCYNTGPGVYLQHPKAFPYYQKVMNEYKRRRQTLYAGMNHE